ncbi:hypothetical protein ACVOMS_27515 [Bradyrhizobium guangxiense]
MAVDCQSISDLTQSTTPVTLHSCCVGSPKRARCGWRNDCRQIEQSARLIDDAIHLVEQGGDHLYMPELLRMKGRVLATLPEPKAEQAEAYFMQSLDLSRRNGAKAWELRAAVDLAGFVAERGRRDEAKRLLQSVLEGFAEGSETEDIRIGNELLRMLSAPSS